MVIVNVSSHDDPFSRANIAWIIIDEEKRVHVDIKHLSSLVEQIIAENGQDVEEKLKGRCHLSEAEAQAFISYVRKDKSIFEHMPSLVEIKFRYGLPWELILMLYKRGVKDATKLNERVLLDIYPHDCGKMTGIYRIHWKRAYAKFLGEKSNEIYLMNPLPIAEGRIMVFAYATSKRKAIYRITNRKVNFI